MFIQKKTKKVVANEELEIQEPGMEPEMEGEDMGGEVVIEPEATDLLFEAEDVAELVAEVTGMPVEVSVEEDSVTFAVGDDEFIVEAEGDEEILEAATNKVMRGKRTVSASTRRSSRKMPSRNRR